MKIRLLFSFSILILCSCVNTSVLNTDNAIMDITPKQVSSLEDIDSKRVVWGGVIVDAKNLQNYTQLEVLAYPLRRQLHPDTNKTAVGRFIMHHAGYLETEDYAPGRKLTVVGSIIAFSPHTVGDAKFEVPLLQSEEIHLWSASDLRPPPQFSFGLGVSVGN